MAEGVLIAAVVFQQAFEPMEALVPFAADRLHPLLQLVQRLRRQIIVFVAAVRTNRYEAGVPQHVQMLENALARDRIQLRKLGRRPWTLFGERFQQLSAHRIAQGGE